VLSLYFQDTRHYSAAATGLAFAPATVAVGAANLSAGRLARVAGPRATLAGAAVLLAAGLGGMLIIGPGTAYAAIVVQFMAVGFGLGVIVPVVTAALLGSVDRSRSGLASGTLNTARQTGSVIGVGLFGSLAAGHLVSGLRLALVISVGLALLVAGLAAGVQAEA
jgi:MFS transporter, DHA2 family, methylenomycin A resistance protein